MKYSAKLLTLFFFFSLSSAVLALPLGFIDLGRTTVDQNSGLEWLDLTETSGRIVLDVMSELESGSGLGAEGWRYANLNDFFQLVNNYFGLALSTDNPLTGDSRPPGVICDIYTYADDSIPWGSVGSCPTAPVTRPDTDLFPEFVSLFGNTYSPGEHPTTRGFLGTDVEFYPNSSIPSTLKIFSAYVSGPWSEYLLGTIENSRDFYLCDDYGAVTVQECLGNQYTETYVGSYLIREYSVPEPSTFILLTLGLVGLGFNRRWRFH